MTLDLTSSLLIKLEKSQFLDSSQIFRMCVRPPVFYPIGVITMWFRAKKASLLAMTSIDMDLRRGTLSLFPKSLG